MSEISEYFKEFREESQRLHASFREARMLGQDERAVDIVGQMYDLLFEHYRASSRSVQIIDEFLKSHPSETVSLQSCRNRLNLIVQSQAKSLNVLCSEMLEIETGL